MGRWGFRRVPWFRPGAQAGAMPAERFAPPPLALDDPSRDEPIVPHHATGIRVLFHGIGVVVLLGSTAVAAVFAFFISWGATTCSQDTGDPALVAPLRRDLLLVVLAWAAVPALWALLARVARFAWLPWAVGSAGIVTAGIAGVMSIREVGSWCF
jgi:hypothetical protein